MSEYSRPMPTLTAAVLTSIPDIDDRAYLREIARNLFDNGLTDHQVAARLEDIYEAHGE